MVTAYLIVSAGLQTSTLLLPHVPLRVLHCWLVDTAYAMESLTILQRGLLEDCHLMRQHLLSSYMMLAITLPWLVNTARFKESLSNFSLINILMVLQWVSSKRPDAVISSWLMNDTVTTATSDKAEKIDSYWYGIQKLSEGL